MNLDKLINNFWSVSKNNPELELYNEAGLQHEVAFYLREKLPKRYKVQLERSIYDVFDNPRNEVFVKKEMDIYVSNKDHSEQYCIELKFPTKGAFPRRMHQTLKDVKFIEQLKNKACFNQVALLFITNQPGFKSTRNDKNKGIYKMFRDNCCLKELRCEDVPRFIKDSEDFQPLKIKGEYRFNWDTFGEYHYFTICI